MFLLGKKKTHNLHFHPQSFYAFVWSECKKQKQFFCFEALTSGQNSSVLSYGETGEQRYIFWVLFGPCLNRPTTTTTTGRRYQRRALPTAWCLSWGRTEEKPPLLTQGSWWAGRTRPSPALTQRKSNGAVVHQLYLKQDSWDGQSRRTHRWWFWGCKTIYPEGRPLCSAKQQCNRACCRFGIQQRVRDVCARQGPASERKRLTPAASQPG